jgi:beta-phosphoglucomutase family hydrolase
MLGLPDHVTACLFDLDGVLTDTASVHDEAWTETFNAFLKARATSTGTPYVPFDPENDYDKYVDGRPRPDGVRTFLKSRGIELPEGKPDDTPDTETINGLGNRKNVLVLKHIKQDGVKVFEGSRRYLQAARDAGLRRFVVSSSANTAAVLEVTGLGKFVEGRVDGVTIETDHLKGKPAPDTFLAGAKLAGVEPSEAVVFEDALAGVEAGHAGKFGFVVGVNRLDATHGKQLKQHGADIVVTDLAELMGNDGEGGKIG